MASWLFRLADRIMFEKPNCILLIEAFYDAQEMCNPTAKTHLTAIWQISAGID
jgi:hypothetical protein